MLAEMGSIMSKHVFAVLFVVLLFSWPGTAAAQSDALMQAFQQYQALEKQGRYAEAERFARKALELGEREFGADHPNTATMGTVRQTRTGLHNPEIGKFQTAS